MKKLKNNKKGFTLIELLAVIVILAILVAVAVPTVMRYLASSRQDTFATNAERAIETVRTDVAFSGINVSVIYTLEDINKILDKKLTTSPYGNEYNANSYVAVEIIGAETKYSVCLTDGTYGISAKEDEIESGSVTTSTKTCTAPATDGGNTAYKQVTPADDGGKTSVDK